MNECLSEESDRERERGEGWQMGGQRRVGGGNKKNKSVCVGGGNKSKRRPESWEVSTVRKYGRVRPEG